MRGHTDIHCGFFWGVFSFSWIVNFFESLAICSRDKDSIAVSWPPGPQVWLGVGA